MSIDPHHKNPELFGVPGKEVVEGGRKYVLVYNTSGPEHRCCGNSEEERKYMAEIKTSGEYGSRDDLGTARIGFRLVRTFSKYLIV